MSNISTITDKEISYDRVNLRELWTAKSTFVLVPNRGLNSEHWLHQAIQNIPKEYIGHVFGILTSGSTGEPKLILGDKNRSEKLVRVLHGVQDSSPVNETICVLPLSYSYAFVNQWLWAQIFARKLQLTNGFSEPDTLKTALLEARHAMLCLVGSQVALIRRFYPESVFPGITRLHFAGGRFPQEQLEFLEERFPNAKIFNNYGCTEAMPRLTIRAAEDADDASCIGFALPGVEMKSGKDKVLSFRSPYRAVAYIDNSGFQKISDDKWVPIGDLGEQLDDGSWRLLGRASDVFKRYGEKISLPKVLTTIKAYWNGDASFYLQTDPAGDQAYVLVLSPKPSEEDLREILMGFRKNHTRAHWPLRIESLDQMPFLANSKTDLLGLKNAQGKIVHWRQRI